MGCISITISTVVRSLVICGANRSRIVIVPYQQWTGGIEALHTFASRASRIGHEAIMADLDLNNFVRSGDLHGY